MSSDNDVSGRLLELARLREDGLLTDKEFQVAKADLLGSGKYEGGEHCVYDVTDWSADDRGRLIFELDKLGVRYTLSGDAELMIPTALEQRVDELFDSICGAVESTATHDTTTCADELQSLRPPRGSTLPTPQSPDQEPDHPSIFFGGNEASGWAVAAAPLIGLGVSAVVAYYSTYAVAVTSGWITFLAVNTVLALLDRLVLRTKGRGEIAWAFFLMPVYLWRRQRQLRRSQAPLVVWLVAFVLSIILQSSVLTVAANDSPITLDVQKLQGDIATWATKDDAANPTVTCPQNLGNLHVGSAFLCTINWTGDTGQVEVVVTGSNGTVRWQSV